MVQKVKVEVLARVRVIILTKEVCVCVCKNVRSREVTGGKAGGEMVGKA